MTASLIARIQKVNQSRKIARKSSKTQLNEKKREKKKSKHEKPNKSDSGSTSGSDISDSSDHKRKRKKGKDTDRKNKQRRKKEKRKKKREKKEKRRKRRKESEKEKTDVRRVEKDTTLANTDGTRAGEKSPSPPSNNPRAVAAPKKRSMVPMTKEEYEKQQAQVRRVYDPETGRHRLIKGTGEVLEEIVSRERHKAINKTATQGDGAFFQANLGLGDK